MMGETTAVYNLIPDWAASFFVKTLMSGDSFFFENVVIEFSKI